MLYSIKMSLGMLRWNHAMTAIPVKYLWANTHHCSSVQETKLFTLAHIGSKHIFKEGDPMAHTLDVLSNHVHRLHPCRNQIYRLLPASAECKYKRSTSASTESRPQNLMCLYSRPLPHTPFLQRERKRRDITNISKSYNNLCTSVKDNMNELETHLFFDCTSLLNPARASVEPFPNRNVKQTFDQDSSKNVPQSDNEPADDPKQKLRLLTEKIKCEIPMFLCRKNDYHDFSIYTNSIELYVTLKKIKYSTSGLSKYEFIVSMFRHFNLFYLSKPDVEILNITTNEEQNIIDVRWRIAGWPPLGILTTLLLRMPVTRSYYDYSSTLYVTKEGLIWRHDLSKLQRLSDGVPLRSQVAALKRRTIGAVAALTNYFVPHATDNLHAKCGVSSKPIQS